MGCGGLKKVSIRDAIPPEKSSKKVESKPSRKEIKTYNPKTNTTFKKSRFLSYSLDQTSVFQIWVRRGSNPRLIG